jgi:hypothetical protein
MKSHIPFVAALLTAMPTVLAQSGEMIPPEMAPKHVGKEGMVCGKVQKAKYAENTEGQPTFLYMGGTFPRHTFSARIAGSDRSKFSFPPENLEGKDICVMGKIKRDNSRAEIEVTTPSNVKLATIK